MTKREVFQLLRQISHYYDSYEINQEKVDQWYKILKDFSFAKLETNLQKHVQHSTYPPKISELIQTVDNYSRYIPNVEETYQMLNQPVQVASKEKAEAALQEIAKILHIQRG